MHLNELTDLVNGYLRGETSPEQEQAFFQAVEVRENEELLKQLLEQHFHSAVPDRGVPEVTGQAILDAIYAATETRKLPVVYKIPLRYIAVAASLIIVAVAGWVLVKNRQATPESGKNAIFSEDRQPGGSRATLTLADGSTILLDSAANGNLARQGNTQIIKLDNGQLAYQNATGTAAGWNTIATPNGGMYRIVLPDGSRVWLNAASSIRFPTVFNNAERRVQVTGEVYVEVQKNASKPFLVQVNKDVEVEVLGTSFNTNAYANEPAVKTTLFNGSVRVISQQAGSRSVTLLPGQQAIAKAGSLQVKEDVDAEQVIAWKNGYFHFDGMGLQEVMRQLERWYNISVEYKGNIPDKHFGGDLPRTLSLQQLVKLLQFGEVSLELKDNRMIITGD